MSGSVERLDNQGPAPTPLQPGATLVALPGADLKAILGDKLELFSTALGSTHQINTDSKTLKEKEVVKLGKELWDGVEKFIQETNPGAEVTAIETIPNPNSKDKELIKISYRDSQGIAQRPMTQERLPQELLNKIERCSELIRPKRGGVNLESFQSPFPDDTLPATYGAFVKEGHLVRLTDHLPAAARKEFLRNTLTTEIFIQEAAKGLGEVARKKKEELDKTPLLPHLKRKEAEEEWQQLNDLYTQFASIGERRTRYDIFSAIGTWNNLKTNGASDEQIQLCANQVTLNARVDLRGIEKRRKEKHSFKNSMVGKALITITPGTTHYQPLGEKELGNHSLEQGDLLLRSQNFELQKRLDSTERSGKKTPVEQLVVETMMHLLDPDVKVDATHPLLKVLSGANRGEVIAALETAKVAPRLAHHDLASTVISTNSLQEQISKVPEGLKSHFLA